MSEASTYQLTFRNSGGLHMRVTMQLLGMAEQKHVTVRFRKPTSDPALTKNTITGILLLGIGHGQVAIMEVSGAASAQAAYVDDVRSAFPEISVNQIQVGAEKHP